MGPQRRRVGNAWWNDTVRIHNYLTDVQHWRTVFTVAVGCRALTVSRLGRISSSDVDPFWGQCYGQEVAMEIFMGSGGRALHYCNNLIIIAIILNNNACFQLVAHYLDGDGAEDLFF